MDSLLHNPMVSSVMEEQPSKSVTSENEIRKMMITPALKILNDPDNSVKSLHVLIRTMDRCCREEKKQSVFLGCEGDEDECKLAIGKLYCKFFSVIILLTFPLKCFQFSLAGFWAVSPSYLQE